MSSPANLDSRLFPPVRRDLYLVNYEEIGWCDGRNRSLAVAVLALNRRKINGFKRFTTIGLDTIDQAVMLLKDHALALNAELDGLICRADFHWRQAHRRLARLAKNPAVWAEVLADISRAPTAPFRQYPQKLVEALVSEIFIDIHRAFLRGYLRKNQDPGTVERSFAHLGYAWSLVPIAGWSNSEATRILGDDSLRVIEAGISTGRSSQAQSFASMLLLRAPEETAYQNALAQTYVAEANTHMTNGSQNKDCIDDAATLGQFIYKLKKLRLDYPHNLFLFETIARLQLMCAQRLADAGQFSEALLDAQAAATYQPDLDEANKLRASLEVEIQRIRVQMAAPEAERPAMTKRESKVLAQEAAKGFRLADTFKRSDEAHAVEEDLPVARGRRLWEELGLPPLERVDHRPLALKDAFDTILHSPPSELSGIAASWDWVSRDNPHLASLDRRPIYAALQQMIFGGPAIQTRGPEDGQEPSPILASPEFPSSEPFLEWLVSSEGRWLKIQCVSAILLIVIFGFMGVREYSHRGIRSSAYIELHRARDQGDYRKTMDAAERFLENRVVGRDARTTEVEGLYSEAIVRWFEQGQPSVDEAERQLARFRQLTGIR